MHTTIYNDGDLVARNLEGEWKLTASHGIKKASQIVREDSLPSFLPLPLQHYISGEVSALWCEPKIVCQVNVDLTYVGLDDLEQKYHATYDYDFPNRRLIQKK